MERREIGRPLAAWPPLPRRPGQASASFSSERVASSPPEAHSDGKEKTARMDGIRIYEGRFEGRVGFEPTTPGLSIRRSWPQQSAADPMGSRLAQIAHRVNRLDTDEILAPHTLPNCLLCHLDRRDSGVVRSLVSR
jgi:hypothetical protein